MICDVCALFRRLRWLWDGLVFPSVIMQNSPPLLHFNILTFYILSPWIYIFRDNLAENFGLSAFEGNYSHAK